MQQGVLYASAVGDPADAHFFLTHYKHRHTEHANNKQKQNGEKGEGLVCFYCEASCGRTGKGQTGFLQRSRVSFIYCVSTFWKLLMNDY